MYLPINFCKKVVFVLIFLHFSVSDFLYVQSVQEIFGLSCYEWLQGTLSIMDECINTLNK